MKLPLPTYKTFINLYAIGEALHMFVNQMDTAIKYLIAEPNMQFHGKNHLIKLLMFHAGLFMCKESYRDVEQYLGDGVDALLRDFGADYE